MPTVYIVNQAALTPRESGGTRHFSLSRSLLRHGWQPIILREGGNNQLRDETIEGVRFIRLPGQTSKRSSVQRLIGWFRFARQVLTINLPEKPDIIIGSSPPLFAAAASLLLARRHGVPFVLEIRDIWPESIVQITHILRWHPLVVLMAWMERWLYRRADLIVTLFPESIDYFVQQHNVPRERIRALPNGIDTDLITVQNTPPVHDGFHLYYFGALGIPNGLEIAVQAIQQLPSEIHLHLVGDGVCKPSLMEQGNGLPNLHFASPVPKDSMGAALAEADAFLILVRDLPLYRWGASPNKLYDYLYAARPVLYAGTRPPAIIDVAGLATTPEANALATSIRQLANLSPAERAAMGERGRAYVLAHHDMQELGTRLAEWLTSLRRPYSE